jgi:MoaA/NifB/PqqE/SkfB family radical SAM enzyme
MPFCSALTNHLNLDTDGRFRPCCIFRLSTQPLSVGELSWKDYRNSKFYQELKSVMSTSDWHEGCTACKINEDFNLKSQRHSRNRDMSGIGDNVEFIDLFIDNHCNLSCKTCGPWLSSSWQKVVKKNKFISIIKPDNKQNTERSVFEIIKEVDLTHLKKLKIQGGEPFLSKKFNSILKLIREIKPSLEHLLIITNSTFFPQKDIAILSEFNKVEILLSIDGIGDINRYIRHGSSWSRVEKTAKKWKDLQDNYLNFNIGVNFTLCGLNLHQYLDVKKWCEDYGFKFHLNLLKYPQELSINSLPESYIQLLKDQGKLNEEEIFNIIEKRNPLNSSMVKNYLRLLDLAHQTSIEIVLPELALHLKK